MEEKYGKGEVVSAADLNPALMVPGQWIASTEGRYYGEECCIAGRVRRVVLLGGASELVVSPTGTQSEALLRYCTGHSKGWRKQQ